MCFAFLKFKVFVAMKIHVVINGLRRFWRTFWRHILPWRWIFILWSYSVVTRFSQQSLAFDPRQVCVGFVVGRMALRQVFSRVRRFSCQYNSTKGHHAFLAVWQWLYITRLKSTMWSLRSIPLLWRKLPCNWRLFMLLIPLLNADFVMVSGLTSQLRLKIVLTFRTLATVLFCFKRSCPKT